MEQGWAIQQVEHVPAEASWRNPNVYYDACATKAGDKVGLVWDPLAGRTSNAERGSRGVSGERPLWHALPHTSAAADLWAERDAVNGVPGGRSNWTRQDNRQGVSAKTTDNQCEHGHTCPGHPGERGWRVENTTPRRNRTRRRLALG